jgi:predicted nucleotidyltransferase
MGTSRQTAYLLTTLVGKTRGAVLALFYSRVDESFYLRQVVRLAGAGLGAVQRELQRLSTAGILLRKVQGRQVYYQANPSCPIFSELQGLILKTAGAADVLRAALAGLSDRTNVAFLYGSVVKGTATAASDVDLMVVGEATFGEVVEALEPAQEKLRREVNPTVYPPEEFRKKVAGGHHFLQAVLKGPKVFVLGGEDELARLAQERLVNAARDQFA